MSKRAANGLTKFQNAVKCGLPDELKSIISEHAHFAFWKDAIMKVNWQIKTMVHETERETHHCGVCPTSMRWKSKGVTKHSYWSDWDKPLRLPESRKYREPEDSVIETITTYSYCCGSFELHALRWFYDGKNCLGSRLQMLDVGTSKENFSVTFSQPG